MEDLKEIISEWSQNGAVLVLARVVKTWGSSPRTVGSMMVINQDQKISGSVSGGCVEGAVVKQAHALFAQHTAEKLSFGVSDEEAWSVGLSCGGSIEVYVQAVDFSTSKVWRYLLKNWQSNQSCLLISDLNKNENWLIEEDGAVTGSSLSPMLIKEAHTAFDERVHRICSCEGRNYFIQVFPRKPTVLIIGVAHIAVDLVTMAHMHDFETIVIDPRGYFAQNTYFETEPTQIFEAYPSEVLHQLTLDPYTFCTILSHDPKIDDNALEILLPSKVAYIGALGSKKTHQKRIDRLIKKGISQDLISKIQAPIGVPIHAKSAKEIALAIMSEIIKFKNQYQ
jgi:xanthine dehydrogenase accessory factor|tara:strand:+ start:3466 stop:4479 length:1014 start_codon:yes stop_codon:yes gene_type:complete